MRFVLAIAVIAIVCGGAMYQFNPAGFNKVLTTVGITSWHAPG
jgi:type IV secretory pathway VirB2 component (pilin)